MSETLFKEVRYTLRLLVDNIKTGEIGLPDIQRPFVWSNIKVRDLFDSMYRGYPVGFFLFWQNVESHDAKSIGSTGKQKAPRLLIVDGQQRLTSLFAVIQGESVVRDDYSSEKIDIAFNPLKERFEVADAAIRNNKYFIPNISAIWNTDLFDLADEYLAAVEPISDAEKRKVRKAIQRVHALESYPFTALELAYSLSEEQVADVFVRINSTGTSLNQSDFILTLMSVFWDEGRSELERFCRQAKTPSSDRLSPYNHFIEPSPDQLLRVSVGVAFKRARLQHVYSLLRGKDLETGDFSDQRREAQFGILREAQKKVLHLDNWHDFLRAIRQAGYVGKRFVTSDNTLLFCYTLYLLGKCEYQVPEESLRRVIGRWFFMSSLTGRYAGSSESTMEFDLARLRGAEGPDNFLRILDGACDATFTNDFWTISLPNDLATSSMRSPSLFAYYASLVLLNAKAFFSSQPIEETIDPALRPRRSGEERHLLFSKKHLDSLGYVKSRDTNQIANCVITDDLDHGTSLHGSPASYLPALLKKVDRQEAERMYYWHALPLGWETLNYQEFLMRRRELMAKVMQDASEHLRPAHPGSGQSLLNLADLIQAGETKEREFKSTLSTNLHTNSKDPRIEMSCLKTVAAFLNSQGGTLVVGVADDGTPVGIDADCFANEDRMNLHFSALIKDRIGPQYALHIHPHFADYQDKRVLVVECSASQSPAYVKDGTNEFFFVRNGSSTISLNASQTQDYIRQRF